MKRPWKTVLLAGAGLMAAAAPAQASLADWSVSPLVTKVGEADFRLGGEAYGAVFANDQPAFPGLDTSGVTGALRFYPRLERTYDSGLVIGVHASILAYRDALTADSYGGTVFEKVYGSIQMGLGTIEVGQTDGAADSLAISGPKVQERLSLDDPEQTFFRDPFTHHAFDSIFRVVTAVDSSFNFAKFSYYSPRLFGVELAASFAPSEGKDVIPLISSGPHVPNHQKAFWEFAANYTNDFGPVSLGAYGGVALAHNDAKTPGHQGLTDYAFGAAADWDVNDDLKLSLGGAWRQSNAYTFSVNDVLANGTTRAWHLSTTATYGSWIAGGEFVEGTADGGLGAPTLGQHGYQASLAYVLNSNLQVTAGWQQLRFARDAGFFYNGLPVIKMNAEYLQLDFHV